MALLNDAFEAETGKSIIHVLEKDSGGHFLYALRGLALGPLGFDVWLVHHACHGVGQHGMGHHEDILTEVLAGRPNSEIQALKAAYHKVFHAELAHVVKKELTHHTERMFTMILAVYPSLFVNILTCLRVIVHLRIIMKIQDIWQAMSKLSLTPLKDVWEPMILNSAVSSSIVLTRRSVRSLMNTNNVIIIPFCLLSSVNSAATCDVVSFTSSKEH